MTRRKSAVRVRLSLFKYCRVAERESGVVTWRLMSVRFRSLQLWGLSSFGRTSALQAEEAGSKPAVLHFICLRRLIGQDWVASNHLMRVRVVPESAT